MICAPSFDRMGGRHVGPVFSIGAIVTHRNRPEWGPGKVFCISGTHALVGFRDCRLEPDRGLRRLSLSSGLLDLASDQGEPELNAWEESLDDNCRPKARPTRARKKVVKKTAAAGE
jgi:hypothetical protein